MNETNHFSNLSSCLTKWQNVAQHVVLLLDIENVDIKLKDDFCKDLFETSFSAIGELHDFLSKDIYRPIIIGLIKKYKASYSDVAALPPLLKDDMDLMKMAMEINPQALGQASQRIRDDQDIAEWSTTTDPPVLHYTSNRWMHDRDLQRKALIHCPSYISKFNEYCNISDDKEMMSICIKANPVLIVYAGDRLKNDVDIITLAVDNLGEGQTMKGRVSNNILLKHQDIMAKAIKNDLSWIFYAGRKKAENHEFWQKLQNSRNNISFQDMQKAFQKLGCINDATFSKNKEDIKRITENLVYLFNVNEIERLLEVLPEKTRSEAKYSFEDILSKKKLLAIHHGKPLNNKKSRQISLK